MSDMNQLAYTERSRTYHYQDGSSHVFKNIVAVGVSKSGFHKLNTSDGMKHLVAPGWRFITLDMDEWTF